jgi:carboxyl-terminal processing protease
MKRYRVHSLMLIVLLVVALAAPALPRAEAADAGFVLTTLQTLRENYVDPISSVPLLNAALAAVQQKTGVAPFDGPIPAAASETRAAALFTQRFDEIFSRVRGQYSATDLAYVATSGMLESLHDSHTGFIPPAVYQEEKRKENGEAAFSGIGIVLLTRDGQFYIREVFLDSPAATSGLRPFDRIVSVDGQAAGGRAADAVAGMIRGPAGTTVVIKVERPNADGALEFPVVRGPIRMPAIVSRMLEGRIGYIRIYEFVPGVGGKVRDAIFTLRRNGLRALILDLRANPGGLVDELWDISAALLPQSSPILQMTKRNGKTVLLETLEPPILPTSVPIVTLVDEGSASASELLAAALQEQTRAVITGVKTAGAVEIGITVDLPEEAGMEVTVARLLSGRGVRLEGRGVIPDETQTLETSALNSGRDSQMDKALELLKQRLGDPAGAGGPAGTLAPPVGAAGPRQ